MIFKTATAPSGKVRIQDRPTGKQTSQRPLSMDGQVIEMVEPIALGSTWLATWRLVFYLCVTLSLSLPQLLFLLLRLRWAESLPVFYHRLCCRLFGFEIVKVGQMSATRPTLFVSNHSSYLDIPILGAILPASFVAKREVASWPGFGILAKLQRTVFVDRKRNTTHRQRDDLQARLEAGDNLILFPEGTSNDGNRVLAFRSALFSVAEREIRGGVLAVQPISVSYTSLNGVPLGHGLRPLLAWYGDMTLGPHLWHFCRLGRVRVVVEFHPPTSILQVSSRKDLSRHCFDLIANGVSRALAGVTGGLTGPAMKSGEKD